MIRLAVHVPKAQAETVLAYLLELVPAGFEERELDGGMVEYALYGAAGELPALPALRATVGEALVEISASEVPDDWPERWKEFHRPVVIESPSAEAASTEPPSPAVGCRLATSEPPALHLRAPWLAPSEREDALEIVIDPGQAFGTGAHATTRLCLELLLELSALGERGPVLDIGTGSGVLAIAAALLGYRPVLAVDNDRASVDAASANAASNSASIEVRRMDFRHARLPWVQAPLVLANLVRPLLLELAAALPAAPAHVLAGGLLHTEVDEVVKAYADRLNVRERGRRQSGEWAAVWLTAE
jgi:ribosomal protein L11 methyltransferase